MAIDKIDFEWANSFQGIMQSPSGHVHIGTNDGEMRPYHLLFGALGSCFYHTFLSVVEKKRLSFSGARMEISGTKREEVPTTLEHVVIRMTIINPSNEEQFLKSAQLGAKYCSIHETISKVATIDLEVSFEYYEQRY
jgi:putative redox protein